MARPLFTSTHTLLPSFTFTYFEFFCFWQFQDVSDRGNGMERRRGLRDGVDELCEPESNQPFSLTEKKQAEKRFIGDIFDREEKIPTYLLHLPC